MNRIFMNQREQVRSGWKIATAFMLYIMIRAVLEVVVQLLPLSREVLSIAASYIGEVAFILAALATLKIIDEKRPGELGLISIRRGFRDLMAGLVLGAVSMTVIFAVLYGFDRVSLANSLSNPSWTHFVWSGLLLYIAVGFAEEVFFRGYCITALMQTRKTGLAIIVSSLLFSFGHIFNPNVSNVGVINIFIIGLLFAFMYLKTGNLWMPIGFHITWNYFQGNIFGFPVSGTAPHGIYNIDGVEGALWSGGSFGPEGGLLATVIIVLLFLTVWKYPKRKMADSRLSP